ncbi:putative selenate ABC transporter substrate-binding protein [Neobacillus sp. LXY-4]|uniref:putative selenate ABC transporter substrate-binding protein n=1 Tax=Neobacillus sp. LXY-4 TaxID=3379826 RepID=UPI003EE1B624
MKKLLTLVLAALFIFSLAACSGNTNTDKDTAKDEPKEETTKQTIEVLKIGMIPDQNVADLNRSMESFAEYLAKELDMKVEFVTSMDYAALVTAFERGEIHLAWFGGLTGVQARSLVPEAEAIAQRPIDEKFKSVFIAQKGLNIKSLEDLKGKTFTFGSESSTSGNLMPRYFLMEEGINPDKDFDGAPNYSGSHDKTYKLVETGTFQAGALNISVWDAAVAEGKVDTSKVEVFYTTPEYYDYNWTVNKMDDETKEKIKDVLLNVSGDQEILKLLNTDKFIETNNDNYKAIETVAKELKIIK